MRFGEHELFFRMLQIIVVLEVVKSVFVSLKYKNGAIVGESRQLYSFTRNHVYLVLLEYILQYIRFKIPYYPLLMFLN